VDKTPLMELNNAYAPALTRSARSIRAVLTVCRREGCLSTVVFLIGGINKMHGCSAGRC